VLLVADGSSFAETAAITGLSVRTVYHLVGQYLSAHSVAALHEQARSGRPPAAAGVTGANASFRSWRAHLCGSAIAPTSGRWNC
jgi:hypothetical protein